ncbi:MULTISPECIES: hypothetical protein [Anaeromyxobacter]|uniref:hypothetical protein n=1 Tax=Anaeromyxobacter TaxID=161492 RepID=UPI001F55F26E|nr:MULTISPECIES: hypothetical protein [unclassified Anaeromyxobacter]
MRHEPQAPTTDSKDLRLPNGCLLCGGDLDVRVTDGEARSFCGRCRWISRPHMQRQEDGIHIVHPAGGIA